jgi:hypothetical protein
MDPTIVVTVVSLVVVLLVMFIVWSRIEGSLSGITDTEGDRIRKVLNGKDRKFGNWTWTRNGQAYYYCFWTIWRVPVWMSLRAFKIVELDMLVNGD